MLIDLNTTSAAQAFDALINYTARKWLSDVNGEPFDSAAAEWFAMRGGYVCGWSSCPDARWLWSLLHDSGADVGHVRLDILVHVLQQAASAFDMHGFSHGLQPHIDALQNREDSAIKRAADHARALAHDSTMGPNGYDASTAVAYVGRMVRDAFGSIWQMHHVSMQLAGHVASRTEDDARMVRDAVEHSKATERDALTAIVRRHYPVAPVEVVTRAAFAVENAHKAVKGHQ